MEYLVKPDDIRHVVHAVSDDFFDVSRLDDRKVISEYSLSYTQQDQFPKITEGHSLGKDVFIEEADGTRSKKGHVISAGLPFHNTTDDKRYFGATGVVSFDENKRKIPFSDDDDTKKLVVLENGDVVGVIASHGKMKKGTEEYPMSLLVPTVSFIVPPTEDIKHYARANFNLEAIIKGRTVLEELDTGWAESLVYLEESNPDIHFELRASSDSLYIGKQKYDGAWHVHSYVEANESELDALYERNALMTTPDSIGKALLMRGNPHLYPKPPEEIVAGIVVEHTAEYNEHHGRWYAKTKVCPANRFTLKG